MKKLEELTLDEAYHLYGMIIIDLIELQANKQKLEQMILDTRDKLRSNPPENPPSQQPTQN